MVKRRTPTDITTTPTPEDLAQKVAAFAAGAEGVVDTPITQEANPNASRDYKSIRVPFNEHEYDILDKAARLTGRSKLNFIRWAILQMAEQAKKDH
jgi:hypothetical protein